MEPESFFIINIYNEKQRSCIDSSMTESRSDPPHTPRYIVDRLLLSLKVKAPTILVGDFNLYHPRWNTATDPTKISKAQPLVHWLDRHKAK